MIHKWFYWLVVKSWLVLLGCFAVCLGSSSTSEVPPLVLDPQQKRKGVEGLIDIENPNRVIQTTKKVTQLDLDGPKELSRRERWVPAAPCNSSLAAGSSFPCSVSVLLKECCYLKQALSSSKLGSLCFKMGFLRNFTGAVCPLGAAGAVLESGSLPWCSDRKGFRPFLS